MANETPLKKLNDLGQSIWLDFIRRGMLKSGELSAMIDNDGLRGVTSNPAIFEKAIDNSSDYDEAIRELALEGKSTTSIYQTLTIEDVQRTADLFAPIYQQSDGRDGFVSLEVSPYLAYDTAGTIAEARRLWQAVDRKNVLIKVPGTKEGLPAIRTLISEGINVNVTLLFSLHRYHEVFDAYMSGLEDRAKFGQPLDNVAPVASFFLSRIDVLADPVLENLMHGSNQNPTTRQARRFHGQVAIASAKKAYQIYEKIVAGNRFCYLAGKGARPQRLLWASTSTKNPDYSDVKYVEALIGPATINTIPLETLNAYRDHGRPAQRLEANLDQAVDVLNGLADLGIDLDEITGKEGTGLIPIAGEPMGDPSVYGEDCVFVYVRLADDIEPDQEIGVMALRTAGHPVITINMVDRLDLGQEFLRWEIATAVAGAVLDINAECLTNTAGPPARPPKIGDNGRIWSPIFALYRADAQRWPQYRSVLAAHG